jgi:hypothetical protein
MSADIISLDKLRASGTAKPPEQPPQEDCLFQSEKERQREAERHERFNHLRALAVAGDSATLEKLADYAR